MNRGSQRARGASDPPLSPVLASAYAQPPDSPWDGSSSLLVPGSPRSEGHQSSETGHYVPARSQGGYWSSGETKGKEKEKRGLVSGLGKKLSKKRLRKKKGDEEEPTGHEGHSKERGRGRSGTREEGPRSDMAPPPLPRRGVSVDRPQTIRHRKSLRLSIDKYADDGDLSHAPSSFHGVRSPVYRSTSSSGQSSTQAASDTATKATKKDGGSKHFWRLVRRIGSSGGLRDKYQSNPYSAANLPMPSLDAVLTPSRTEVDGNQRPSRGRRSSVEQLTSATSSKLATPAKTPASTPGLKHASSSVDGHNSYYSHAKGSPLNISARSSTHASFDNPPPSRVFHRTPSSRSSISSFADINVPPPLPSHPPSAFLAQRFGSRSDSGHQTDESYRPPPGRASSQRTRKSSNKSTKTTIEDDWMLPEAAVPLTPPSLPTPPRRPKPAITTSLEDVRLKPEDSNDSSGSPLIPSFTVDNAINQFKPRKRSDAVAREGQSEPSLSIPTPVTLSAQHLEAFPAVRSPSSLSRSTSMPPPPRPVRDARRPTPPRTPSIPHQDSSSSADSSPHAPRAKLKKAKKDKHVSDYPSKHSMSALAHSSSFNRSNGSTPSLPDLPSHHVLSGSSSPLVTSPVSHSSSNPRSPANDFVSVEFRERGSLQLNRGLSEQEKADKWDALLEKSEQAGGTLHLTLGLAPGQLDSDRLTLNSTISVDP
ncbi:hypothetical protein NMY22_g16730 [Coprinellus aureogranulatus]|nr:hypothetical protein NMY22_g16730 [Coprinellus aureogranulatus]